MSANRTTFVTSRFAALAVLLLARPILADVLGFDPESAINRSDLVFVGTLVDVKRWSDDELDHGRGVLKVAEIIAGDLGSGERVLEWSNEKNVACPRIENEKYAGRKGLWFFRRSPDGRLSSMPWFRDLTSEADIRYFSAAIDRFVAPGERVDRVRRVLEENASELPATRFDSAEQFVFSNGLSVETFTRRGVYRRGDVLSVLRASDGYTVGAYSRGDSHQAWAPGIVTARPYESYAVLWEKGYSNVLALEVDRTSPEWDNVAAAVRSKGGTLTAKVLVKRGIVPPAEAPSADEVIAAAGGQSARFRSLLGVVAVLFRTDEPSGLPTILEFLTEFRAIPEESTIVSRERLEAAAAGDAHAFLRASPIPTRDLTGSVKY